MRYQPKHVTEIVHTSRIGILLVNLGTPDAPNTSAVRRYLQKLLSDPRVVEMPRVLWWPLLHGLILRFYPKRSAHKYAQIWQTEGSPLLTHSQQQASLLQSVLSRQGFPVMVALGMRYGEPSIAGALTELKSGHCNQILVLPLYPQYSASSTASAYDNVWQTLIQWRNVPEIRTVHDYHDHPGYIAALASRIRTQWQKNRIPEKLLMSFHGAPARTQGLGDPYYEQCLATSHLLAKALHLAGHQYEVCFQSHFGPSAWLKPYLSDRLAALGKSGVQHVDVVCPGFVGDCLETLQEVAIVGKAIFLQSGGVVMHYIPALNDYPEWIAALAEIARQHLQGWEADELQWESSIPQRIFSRT